MVGTLSRITTLLVAVGILLVGHGLQLTLLPLHAEALGWSGRAIGVTGSSYFLGFVLGCVIIPSLVGRAGHIRTFMVMGAVATVALLGAGLFSLLPAWLALRFTTGFALSGLYMVIESWLSEVSPGEQRGGILSVYTIVCLLSMSAGQGFIGLAPPSSLDLFVVGAALLSLAIIPVGMTRIPSPHPIPSMRFSPRSVLRVSRVAVVCAFGGGLITGAFWMLGPVMGRAFGLDGAAVGIMMSAGILGGALSQLPVGRLSDRTNRRSVIAGLLTAGAIAALIGWLVADVSRLALYVVMFLMGAATLPIYAICVAHASDNTELPLVQIASTVLIMNSLGSILGPVVVALLMDAWGPSSFFGYTLVCLTLTAAWTVHRLVTVERPRNQEHAAVLPKTTQVVAALVRPVDCGLDERTDEE